MDLPTTFPGNLRGVVGGGGGTGSRGTHLNPVNPKP